MIEYLTLAQLIEIHEDLIKRFGGLPGIRDKNLLHSSVESPKMSFGGKELYPSIFEKAAEYLYSIAKGHPFNDANKRTAYFAVRLFLEINHICLAFRKEKLEELVVQVAQGKVSKNAVAYFLRTGSML